MNQKIIKLLMKFLNHYRANVNDIMRQKNEVVEEAQVKINTLKSEHIKKQIDQYDKP